MLCEHFAKYRESYVIYLFHRSKNRGAKRAAAKSVYLLFGFVFRFVIFSVPTVFHTLPSRRHPISRNIANIRRLPDAEAAE